MGAGGSIKGAGASEQKQWGERIMKAESRQQKLEVFAALQRAVRNSSIGKEDQAASKLQAMQRGKSARNPVKGGMDLKAVFSMFANYGKSSKQKGAGDMIESSKFRKMMKVGQTNPLRRMLARFPIRALWPSVPPLPSLPLNAQKNSLHPLPAHMYVRAEFDLCVTVCPEVVGRQQTSAAGIKTLPHVPSSLHCQK